MLLRRFAKMLQRIAAGYSVQDFRKQFAEYIRIDESTIPLDGTNLLFSTSHENRTYLEIGKRSLIGATFIFETNVGFIKIGNNVNIGRATMICRSGITIEDDVTMAWGITLYDHDSHSIYWDKRKNDNATCYDDYKCHQNAIVNKNWTDVASAPIRICSKAWIGFNVIVLKGVTVGEGAVIGAGSIVTHDVPPFCVAAGNPARVVKTIDRYI